MFLFCKKTLLKDLLEDIQFTNKKLHIGDTNRGFFSFVSFVGVFEFLDRWFLGDFSGKNNKCTLSIFSSIQQYLQIGD